MVMHMAMAESTREKIAAAKRGKPRSKETSEKIALGVRVAHARRTAELLLLRARAEAAEK